MGEEIIHLIRRPTRSTPRSRRRSWCSTSTPSSRARSNLAPNTTTRSNASLNILHRPYHQPSQLPKKKNPKEKRASSSSTTSIWNQKRSTLLSLSRCPACASERNAEQQRPNEGFLFAFSTTPPHPTPTSNRKFPKETKKKPTKNATLKQTPRVRTRISRDKPKIESLNFFR